MSQVNPEDVKAFLNQQEAPDTPTDEVTTEPQMPGHEVINLDEAKKEYDELEKENAEIQQNVEAERSKLFEPDKTSLAHLSSWVFSEANLQVEVDAADKSLYLKALLNDTVLELEVALELGFSLLIRATTNFDLDVIYKTLEMYTEEQKVPGPAQYASLVQKCAAALQIVKFADKNLEPPRFEAGAISIEDAAKILKKRVDTIIAKWAWPKWQAAIMALRVFEIKLSICNENARKANFWQTADAN